MFSLKEIKKKLFACILLMSLSSFLFSWGIAFWIAFIIQKLEEICRCQSEEEKTVKDHFIDGVQERNTITKLAAIVREKKQRRRLLFKDMP